MGLGQFYFRGIISVIICLILLHCANKPDNYGSLYSNYIDTSITVYGPYRVIRLPLSKGVPIRNPIQLALGNDGKLYGSNHSGEVYSLEDSDNDGLEDKARLFCDVRDDGLNTPTGIAFKHDTVYIGTSQEIRIYLDRDKDGKADTSWTFFNNIPYSRHPYEWTCGLNFDSDGWLYCALTTDSWNAAPAPDPQRYRGSIIKISPDGNSVQQIASGIRSVYGMDFNSNGDLFFADNQGGGNVHEELNILAPNRFYGHNPKKFVNSGEPVDPALKLTTDIAPAGIIFNDIKNDFGGTAGELFIAFYGPAERWKRGAVARVKIDRKADGSYSFIENPVADIPKISVLAFGKDGGLYVAHNGMADYWYNPVNETSGGYFKLYYDPSLQKVPVKQRKQPFEVNPEISLETGKQLFAERACAACHSIDASSELLGPGLAGIGERLSRGEILDDIKNPSKIIKPSMNGIRIIKKNGEVLLGRVTNSNESNLSMILVGNKMVTLLRSEIATIKNEQKSLMYENLLNGLSDQEIKSLLDYIISLK